MVVIEDISNATASTSTALENAASSEQQTQSYNENTIENENQNALESNDTVHSNRTSSYTSRTEHISLVSQGVEGSPADQCKEDHLLESGEAYETEIFKMLEDVLKSQPMALQQKVTDWAEVNLGLREKLEKKVESLARLHTQEKPPKSCEVEFELRPSEAVKEMYEEEYRNLCNYVEEIRNETQMLFKCLVLKLTDLECSTKRINLAKEILQQQVLYMKSSICAKIANKAHNTYTISHINNKAYLCSKQLLEVSLLDAEYQKLMLEFTGLKENELIRAYREAILKEKIDDSCCTSDQLYFGLGEYNVECIEKISENNIQPQPDRSDESSEINVLLSSMPKIPREILVLKNISQSTLSSKNIADNENVQKQVYKNIKVITQEVIKEMLTTFRIITNGIWNGKLETGMEEIRNEICRQTLELEETVRIGEATSDSIQKENFLP